MKSKIDCFLENYSLFQAAFLADIAEAVIHSKKFLLTKLLCASIRRIEGKIILGHFSWCARRAALCASRPGTWGARPAWPAWETATPAAETEAARWTGAAGGGGPARRNPCWNLEAPPPTDDPRALGG